MADRPKIVSGDTSDASAVESFSDQPTIEQYVSGLLKQIEGLDTGIQHRQPPAPLPVEEFVAQDSQGPFAGDRVDLGSSLREKDSMAGSLPLDVFSPRRSKSAHGDESLSAMRDLANISTQSAIETHGKNVRRRKAAANAVITLMALVSVVYLFASHSADSGILQYARWAALVTALLWGLDILEHFSVVWSQRADKKQALATPPNSDHASNIEDRR